MRETTLRKSLDFGEESKRKRSVVITRPGKYRGIPFSFDIPLYNASLFVITKRDTQ